MQLRLNEIFHHYTFKEELSLLFRCEELVFWLTTEEGVDIRTEKNRHVGILSKTVVEHPLFERLIHILLVVALVVLLIQLITGRRAV